LTRYFERNVNSHTTYDLSGAGSVVTCAGRGIGKAIARAVAAEWAPHNICVDAVGPGLTRTEFSRPLWAETKRAGKYLSAVPKGRMGEPEEIVGAVLFLSSSPSDFITGQAIYVDHGYLATWAFRE
jgi:NAD(P)-dependent dehydrogenase (short-subunit alcohol dehydrogenase family)